MTVDIYKQSLLQHTEKKLQWWLLKLQNKYLTAFNDIIKCALKNVYDNPAQDSLMLIEDYEAHDVDKNSELDTQLIGERKEEIAGQINMEEPMVIKNQNNN